MNEAGQSALFDAFLFFVIALVASGAILGYTALSASEMESEVRTDASSYAQDFRETLMRTTLNDPWYVDGTGAEVHLGQGITVERFLVDELQLLLAGSKAEGFRVTNGVVLYVARSLVRPPFSVGISGSRAGEMGPAVLWIGAGPGPPSERFTSSWSYHSVTGDTVEIAVHLWYA